MITPNAALQTLLDNDGIRVTADLFTITLTDGTVLRWTTADVPLAFSGTIFEVGPLIKRDKLRFHTGLNVDQVQITIIDDGSVTINGQALVAAAWSNLLDYATVQLEIFLSDSFDNTAPGKYTRFVGKFGPCDIEHKTITVPAESYIAQLQATFPKTLILPSCSNRLFDNVCSLLAADYTQSGTVGAGASATQIPLTGISEADGYYNLGRVKFTSGANAGQTRAIKSFASGVATLAYPLDHVPATGDAIDVTAGCDKTRSTCQGRFANLAHFRGFPYVPDPSTQLGGTVSSTEGNVDANLTGSGPARGRGPGGMINKV